jgi:hypothetical protein
MRVAARLTRVLISAWFGSANGTRLSMLLVATCGLATVLALVCHHAPGVSNLARYKKEVVLVI